MTTTLYSQRDYAFGQAMLTLRTEIGLTQAGLANELGVSRRAVGEWEAGSSYPKVEHLKALIALALSQQAFPQGSEAEAIRALWKAAHQKVLLDEHWLSSLLTSRYQVTAAEHDKRADTARDQERAFTTWQVRGIRNDQVQILIIVMQVHGAEEAALP